MLDGTFLDSTGIVVVTLRDTGSINTWIGLVAFFMYAALTAFMLLNLLIGVLCEVVSSVGAEEKDKADVEFMKRTILQELKACDLNQSGSISPDELMEVVNKKTTRRTLRSLDVDLPYFYEFCVLFQNAAEDISIKKAMQLILDCRSTQPATVASISLANRVAQAFAERVAHEKDAPLAGNKVFSQNPSNQRHDLDQKTVKQKVHGVDEDWLLPGTLS